MYPLLLYPDRRTRWKEFENGSKTDWWITKEIKAAGEAVTQEAYEKAYDHVFQILDNLEKLLNDNRYLEGNEITEEDKRLYDILIRFDAVYYFKQRLNRKALRDYDNLWNYAKELYSIPEYKEFADFEKIKQEELRTKEETHTRS